MNEGVIAGIIATAVIAIFMMAFFLVSDGCHTVPNLDKREKLYLTCLEKAASTQTPDRTLGWAIENCKQSAIELSYERVCKDK